MRRVTELLQAIGHGAKVALGALFAAAVLWCIVYRVFIGFTSLWLDAVTIGMTVIILLVAGILKLRDGRSAPKPDPRVAAPTSNDSVDRR